MIKFVDLQKEYHQLSEEIDLALKRVLESGWFINGKELESFEQQFARHLDVEHAVGVNSGSDALFLTLQAKGIGPTDEVITTSFTFISTVDAVVRNSATPVLVDIDPDTFCIDVAQVKAAITKNTKAIIPVHLFGHPVDMDPIIKLAEAHGLLVIEDAAQAHNAEYKKTKLGAIGHAGCFSFYPAKNLGAYGDAGMIVTNDDDLAGKLKMARDYGRSGKYEHDFVGINSRMDEIQAAILGVKLRYLDQWTEARRKVAAMYKEALDGLSLTLPVEMPYAKHVYHLYVVKVNDREKLQQRLSDKGIPTLIHYPVPVHQQKAYADIFADLSLPVTESVSHQVLSLPMHPWLESDQIAQIAKAVKNSL